MAVKPRPASTVVLIDNEYNVFLTQRPKTMKFLGGFYVFPGGGMDSSDSILNEELLVGTCQYDFLQNEHYIAAARELLEEVGIFLGNEIDGSPATLDEAKLEQYRTQLLKRELTFGDILKQEQVQFHFDSLHYFGQITTPERHPIRFETRFFLAMLPEGQTPNPHKDEIDEAFWISPEEGLYLNEKKELLLAPPTIVALESVIAYKNGEDFSLQNDKIKRLEKGFMI